ncbi:S8 family peptidase [Frateuria defendens]|uniref:S8 family peptidase n=1 Tax=Frateuria defendens TaxID=2219559 RepID=UPI00069E86F1|nr:S8 family serine peptidase [Frateuria defendens]
MSKPWLTWLACCALGLAGCASQGVTTSVPSRMPDDEHALVLVMLRVAPPHLRAADDYAGDYTAAPGQAARRRIAWRLAREYRLELVDAWPMPALGLDCFVMRTAPGVSPGEASRALARDARVESAQPMQRFHVLGGRGDPLYPLQPVAAWWRLAELHALATGRDVGIAELDSGVDESNPDLAGQLAQRRDFVGDGYRAELHGTAVAGIIVARMDNGLGIAGVAPRARLFALRACWQTAADDMAAACNSFTLAKALHYALEQRVRILNLSLAGPRDRLLERLLDVALARGVAVVGAVDEATADGGFPASHPGVLAVAGERAGPAFDGALHAPGADIPTTRPGARWGLVAGSSFAAAEVSGLVALLRELSPGLSPAQLRDALGPRTELGLAARRPTMIDACAALARASKACTCGCATAGASTSVPRQ